MGGNLRTNDIQVVSLDDPMVSSAFKVYENTSNAGTELLVIIMLFIFPHDM